MRFRSAAAKILLPLFALSSLGQQPPSSGQEGPVTTFRAGAHIVVLDVIVTDKHGSPVRNLSRSDFKIFEDGQEQAISSFEPPDQHAPVVSDSDGERLVANPDRDPNKIVANPLAILVFDALDTNVLDQAYARLEIKKYLEAHGPTLSQPTALMALEEKRLELLHDYTTDGKVLEDALKKHPAHLPFRLLRSMGEGNSYAGSDRLDSAERMIDAIEALREIATANAQFAGRKNVIWIGPGFPSLSQLQIWAGVGFRGIDQFRATPGKKITLQSWEQETLELIWKSRVSVYTIDPRGLQAEPEEKIVPTTGDLAFEQIATLTGGSIVRNANDIDAQIAKGVEDGGAYYALAYYPSNRDWNGKFRTIKVVTRNPELVARTRMGYYALPDSTPTLQDMDWLLSRAVMNPLPYHSLEVQAKATLSGSQPPTAHITVELDANELHWEMPDPGKRRCEITVVTAGFSSKGVVVGHAVKELEVVVDTAKYDELTKKGMIMNLAMALPPTAVRMRVVARDSTNGNMGTADLTPSGEQFH